MQLRHPIRTLLSLLLPALAAAQSPVFRSDTRIVEVAVIAQDPHHTPIQDLRKEDLRLFDNGIEQTILTYEKIGNAPTQGKPTRLTIIVLDGLNSSWADQIYGRVAVAKMLETFPEGVDRIAIVGLDKELHIVHDFSHDAASLRAAVLSYDRERSLDVESTLGLQSAPSATIGPQPQLTIAKLFEHRAELTSDAFNAIANKLSIVQGEKNLVWVGSVIPGSHNLLDLEAPVRKLAAAKVTVYPVDPRGLTLKPVNDDAATEIARQTGGRAFSQSNDVAKEVRTAIDDSREGYILTYAPTNYHEDGTLHQVTLKTKRTAVDLRYRPWYFADPASLPRPSPTPGLAPYVREESH